MTDEQLRAAATALLNLDAPRSAAALLDSTGTGGHANNRLRALAARRSQGHALAAGVSGVAVRGLVGLLLPLRAERGQPSRAADDPLFLASQIAANKAAASKFPPDWRLPSLRVNLPDALLIDGGSLGLASFLAFVGRAAGTTPPLPVIAIGGLVEGTELVQPVGNESVKLGAVARDLAGGNALVLACRDDARAAPPGLPVKVVDTLDEALLATFGATKFQPSGDMVTLERLLAMARVTTDSERAVRELMAEPADAHPPADRAELRMALGIHLRHLGRISEARIQHALAAGELDEATPVLGPDYVEYLRMQLLATEVDFFDFRDLEPRLRMRLEEPFASLHNRVRCAGMLAQVVSSLGRPEEALRIRTPSLETQALHAAMRCEIPWTLCSLVRDAAAAGRDDLFEEHGRRLLDETRVGDQHQDGFNAAAIARGLALLEPERLVTWATGGRLWGHHAPAPLRALARGVDQVGRYPDIATARALARSWRRTGDPARALSLGLRVETPAETLVRWVAALALLEGALAGAEAADPAAVALWRRARHDLAAAHPPAAGFHVDLASLAAAPPRAAPDVAALESAIDRVWY
jgi:hypothetical protein